MFEEKQINFFYIVTQTTILPQPFLNDISKQQLVYKIITAFWWMEPTFFKLHFQTKKW